MFGEIGVHWSIYLIVQSVLPPALACAPIINTLMLLMGGFKRLERQKNGLYALYPHYAAYRFRTSPLVPLSPKVYMKLSTTFKARCCCEVQDFDI
jgi:steroid 5-alpha reductase family enzyme